jgi:uncharacterized protein (DUF1697 family)
MKTRLALKQRSSENSYPVHHSLPYVLLLRGINVGGKHKVSMSELRSCLESAHCTRVQTYINSGNVLATIPTDQISDLTTIVSDHFQFSIPIIAYPFSVFQKIANQIPHDWLNNRDQKCDVLFDQHGQTTNWKHLSFSSVDQVIEGTSYCIWCCKRSELSQSAIYNVIRSPLYKQVTIRNCNTVRSLSRMIAAYLVTEK